MESEEKIFQPFLDFYWKFMASCFVILIMWLGMNVSIKNDDIFDVINDPIFLLLSSFIIFSLVAWGMNLYYGRIIIIGDDYIIFKSRWDQKKIKLDEITYIKQGKERLFHFREQVRVVRIKLKNRNRSIIIKPNKYIDDYKLTESLYLLSKKL